MTLLAITTFFAYIVINIPQTISPNFFRDEIGMDGALNGYLIAIREVPGFLLIFVAAFLLRHGLAVATTIALSVAGVGYFLFAGAHSFAGLIVPTLIASVGYHSWLQLQDALGLSLARQGEEGSVLGRFRSIGFAGTIVALLVTLAILFFVERTSGDLRAAQGPWLRGLYVATATLRFCRCAGHLPLSRLRQRARRGSCRAANHLAQGVQPLLLAEFSRRLAPADLFRLCALRSGRAVRRRRAHPDDAAGRLGGDQLADRRLGRQARRSLRREADADHSAIACICSSSSASRSPKTSGCST